MVAIFPMLLLWWGRWSIYLHGTINNPTPALPRPRYLVDDADEVSRCKHHSRRMFHITAGNFMRGRQMYPITF